MAVEQTLRYMLGSGLTKQGIDNARAVMLIRAAAASGERQLGMRLVAQSRASWLTWLTVTQREWQRETRRPGRARHSDSIAIRERYVRCGS